MSLTVPSSHEANNIWLNTKINTKVKQQKYVKHKRTDLLLKNLNQSKIRKVGNMYKTIVFRGKDKGFFFEKGKVKTCSSPYLLFQFILQMTLSGGGSGVLCVANLQLL